MYEMMATLYRYNSWAMAQLFPVLHQLGTKEYTTIEASGHGSIQSTLAHLLAIQWGWFSWFDKSLPVADAYARTSQIAARDVPTVKRAEARWKEIERQAAACLDRLDDAQLKSVWSFELPGGVSGAMPLWQMVLHVANHQTHTRAQVIAALRRAGYEPPNTDILNFVWFSGQGAAGAAEGGARHAS